MLRSPNTWKYWFQQIVPQPQVTNTWPQQIMPPAPRSLRLGTIGLHKLSSPPIPHKHLEISAPTNCPSVPGHQHLELSALIKCEPQVSNTGNVDLEYWTLISKTGECRPQVLDSCHQHWGMSTSNTGLSSQHCRMSTSSTGLSSPTLGISTSRTGPSSQPCGMSTSSTGISSPTRECRPHVLASHHH